MKIIRYIFGLIFVIVYVLGVFLIASYQGIKSLFTRKS